MFAARDPAALRQGVMHPIISAELGRRKVDVRCSRLERGGCSLLETLRRAVGALRCPSTAPSWAGLGSLKTLPRRASSGAGAMGPFSQD